MGTWIHSPGLERPTEARRETVVALRAYIPWLQREGLVEPLREKLPPATAALLARPPLPTTWIDSERMYEIYDALSALRGDEAVGAMALEATRSSLGKTLRPILGMYMKLSGSTPASLFGQMPGITSLFIKGVAFHWTAQGESAGQLVIAYAGAAPASVFHVWGGMLRFAFELCQTRGQLSFEAAPDRSAARYRASWAEVRPATDATDAPAPATPPGSDPG